MENKILSEQPDSHMPFQIEKFGYDPKSKDPSRSMGASLKRQDDLFKGIRKYVNMDMESDLRDFLYSPVGIATIAGIDYVGGAPISMLLFSILVSYDIEKWVNEGEPNWLYLICDLICVSTAGFASAEGSVLINAAKKIKFKTLPSFFKYVSENFKSIWQKFVLPISKSIESIIGKIKQTLTKSKPFLSKKISSLIPNILGNLSKLSGTIKNSLDVVIGKVGRKVVTTWGKYKTTNTAIKKLSDTETGKQLTKNILPYINPLLGSDKLDPFLIDLIKNPNSVNLNNYNLAPIFKDNSKDGF